MMSAENLLNHSAEQAVNKINYIHIEKYTFNNATPV